MDGNPLVGSTPLVTLSDFCAQFLELTEHYSFITAFNVILASAEMTLEYIIDTMKKRHINM